MASLIELVPDVDVLLGLAPEELGKVIHLTFAYTFGTLLLSSTPP